MKRQPIFGKTNPFKSVLCGLLFLFLSSGLRGQSYDNLNHLEGVQTETFYSDEAREQAKAMAAYIDHTLEYFNGQIDFEPQVTLLVLSPEDWESHTTHPVYGMPHYTNSKTLVVASENNDFWKSFLPSIDQLPKELAEEITTTYSDNQGNLSLQPFFDLIAIHELGHAFHIQAGLNMQRKWMNEFFPNLFLHTYIAEKKPELLPALSVFPKMVVSSTNQDELKYTTLSELEAKYDEITRRYPSNYGWYQSKLHMAAGEVYDEGGLDAFQNLWLVLKNQKEDLVNSSLLTLLAEQVHQSVADVSLEWDE